MKSFKKISVVLSVVSIGVILSSFAIGADKVAGGKHDFSFNGTAGNSAGINGTLGNQVCIYCHTPHNAGQTRLLWNKAGNGNTTFRLYTSSGTLSSFANKSVLTANSPSILCLSCHDGKTAMNVLHSGGQGSLASAASLVGYPADSRLAYGNTPQILPGYMFGNPNSGPAVGANEDLTNDHPIGFSYTAAQGEKTATNLNAIGSVNIKIKFFGNSKTVECSTCHNPHADGNDLALIPFLVMSNANSALCLSCHNK